MSMQISSTGPILPLAKFKVNVGRTRNVIVFQLVFGLCSDVALGHNTVSFSQLQTPSDHEEVTVQTA